MTEFPAFGSSVGWDSPKGRSAVADLCCMNHHFVAVAQPAYPGLTNKFGQPKRRSAHSVCQDQT